MWKLWAVVGLAAVSATCAAGAGSNGPNDAGGSSDAGGAGGSASIGHAAGASGASAGSTGSGGVAGSAPGSGAGGVGVAGSSGTGSAGSPGVGGLGGTTATAGVSGAGAGGNGGASATGAAGTGGVGAGGTSAINCPDSNPHTADPMSPDWTIDATTGGQELVSTYRYTEINSVFCGGADVLDSLKFTNIQGTVNFIEIFPSNIAALDPKAPPLDYKIDIEAVDSFGRQLPGSTASYTPKTPQGMGYVLNAVALQPVEQLDRQMFVVFRYSGNSVPVSYRLTVQVHIVP
jgi:hypothetical protein